MVGLECCRDRSWLVLLAWFLVVRTYPYHFPLSLSQYPYSFLILGLPATVTSSLTIVARRLGKKNIFVKKLDIVEALGSVRIIASDKTGTLTKNIMTVTNLWTHNDFIAGLPNLSMKNIVGKASLDDFETPVSDVLMCMSVCNAAKFEEEEAIEIGKKNGKYTIDMEDNNNKERKTIGQPSEAAMIKYVDRVMDVNLLRKGYNVVFEIPFNSKRKWHLMIIKNKDFKDGNAEYKLLMKGASEILILKCSTILTKSGAIPLNTEEKNAFQVPPITDCKSNFYKFRTLTTLLAVKVDELLDL